MILYPEPQPPGREAHQITLAHLSKLAADLGQVEALKQVLAHRNIGTIQMDATGKHVVVTVGESVLCVVPLDEWIQRATHCAGELDFDLVDAMVASLREPAQLLVAEPLKYEGDPAVRALADRIGELVQHMERCGKRSDRLQLMSMKQALRRHEAGGSAAEYEEGLRGLREDIAALEAEVTGRRAAPVPGPTLAQRAANELVLGLQALPDHNALRNAVWRALRLLDNDAAEKLAEAQRVYVAPPAAGLGEVTVVLTPPSGDVPRNPDPPPAVQMPGMFIDFYRTSDETPPSGKDRG